MALLVNKLFMFGVIATGLISINVAFTGFCPVGTALRMFGLSPMLGEEKSKHKYLYFMQTDKWYLERRIYLAVGINISVASVIVLTYSAWATLFTLFVGGAMVWFAATGFCVMANGLYWLGAEPRLNPQSMPSGRCEECAMSGVCVGGRKKQARGGGDSPTEPQVSAAITGSYSLRTLP
jgi:hypothetical protein